MNLLKKKQLRSNLQAIIQANQQANEVLEHIIKTYPLHTDDEKNLLIIQEHLNNTSVIFTSMSDSVKHK